MNNDRIVEPGRCERAFAQPAAGMTADSIASLIRIGELAEELGAQRVASDAQSLVERLGEGRFYVACVGLFKRGKSTLIGALIGDPILPAGVAPVTTVPTVVRYGPTRSARIRFQGGIWRVIDPQELHQYVSEVQNPENTKGVQGAEVFVPCELLATGMCLVDTPGLGSIFPGNTAATRSLVPHIDVVLVVVGADPPLAGEELRIVEAVSRQVRDLLVVLNKADRTSDEERRVAAEFTRNVLAKRLGRSIREIYEVSALDQLKNRGPQRDWSRLVEALRTLARQSSQDILQSSGQRALLRLCEELLVILTEEQAALLSPMEDYELRISSLRRTLGESKQSLQDLAYLFMAEQHRLSDSFLSRRKEFLRQHLPQARAELDDVIGKLLRPWGPAFRREAMRAAQQIAEKHVLPWLATEQAAAEEAFAIVASRFVQLANEFLTNLSRAGVPELRGMPHALEPARGLRIPSRFSFEEFLTIARPASPLLYLADVFLGFVGAHGVITRAAGEFLEHLLETNSTRVQSDVLERVQESRSQLETEIRRLLLELGHIAQRAMGHARTAKASGAAAIESKLARLTEMRSEVTTLYANLT